MFHGCCGTGRLGVLWRCTRRSMEGDGLSIADAEVLAHMARRRCCAFLACVCADVCALIWMVALAKGV